MRQVSTRQFTGVLKGIAAGIDISNFLLAVVMVCLNSSSFGSMQKIPRNCLALSSFGLSIAHFCFASLFAASDLRFLISGHTLSGLEVVCFFISLTPDHENHSGGLLFNRMNLVKLVHASDNSLSIPVSVIIDQVMYGSGNVDVLSGTGNDCSLGMFSLTLGST